MYIVKRDGRKQQVFYDKITARNMKLAADLSVDTASLSQTVIRGLNTGMTTRDIDQLSCESAIHRSIYEPDYGILASRIAWNDLHKNTPSTFEETINLLYDNYNHFKKRPNPLISKEVYDFAKQHIKRIEETIDYKKDYDYSYFAFRTLEKSYLQKVNKKIVERPQSMLMRVNLGIHGPSKRNGIVHEGDIDKALESYKAMSEKKFTHATPTLFNAGTNRPQMSSCFLLSCPDSMGDDEYDEDERILKGAIEEESIPECLKHCAKISKYAGGIGVDLSFLRCRGSYIAGTNGRSNGIIPFVKMFNETGRAVDQGGGKRKGAMALYLQPWHPDTPEFLAIRTNTGAEELKARDVFPALWIPDLFFKRLEEDGEWSFFCPGSYPELVSLYGEEFENRYIELEKEGKMVRRMKASELWEKVLKSLDETGLPYMLAKDHVNRKSNQKNIGPILSSNLCVHPDTMILTDKGQFKIKSLENQKVNVWNGEEFSETVVRKTGENKKLIRVNFSNGEKLECTPEHQFYLSDGKKVNASDLKEGMELISYNLPVIEGEENNSDCEIVPMNCKVSEKIKWFYKIYENFGVVYKNNIVIESNSKEFLLNVRLMLQTLGVDSVVNGKNDSHFLFVSSTSIETLKELRFVFNFEDFEHEPYKPIKIVNVELETNIVSDTYCFTEPKRHMGMFNGILTGQCTEIMEYHDPKSIAVCNLASIALPCFVDKDKKTFDFKELGRIVEMVTENLNLVLDKNYSPVRYCAVNNLSYRPIGIGVQGLADVFAMMHLPWEESPGVINKEAQALNKAIFETIYFYSLKKSSDMAKKDGSYDKFEGSPASLGELQYDMWGVKPITEEDGKYDFSWEVPKLDWKSLKENVKKGLRNSLLVAPMPTASTSQILGHNECFEAFTSNIYARKVIAGDFPLVNPHLYRDLNKIGKWNKDNVDKIIKDNGSVQNLDIPRELKNIYKTVWEISQKVVIDMAADRGAFIDQSQSLNIHIARPTPSKLSSMYLYAWKKGLKTLSYYLRSSSATDAVKFTIMDISDPTQKIKEELAKSKEVKEDKKKEFICTDEVCIPCSS